MNLSFPDLFPTPLRVLIDSGSSRSFIDSRFVSDQGIPTTKLPLPLTLRLFDGSIAPSGKISDCIQTQFRLPLLPSETWNFLVTPLDSSCDLVLGLDWLRSRNPIVDWKSGEVAPRPQDSSTPIGHSAAPTAAFVSGATSTTSVPSGSKDIDIALSSEAEFLELLENNDCVLAARITLSASDTTPPSDDLEKVRSQLPPEYQDFADVFSKSKAEALPPHRPYDLSIPISSDAKPPFGPVYRLSEVEERTLKDFIDENLAKGFVRPSSSPAGAPVLFAKKKDGSLRLCVDYRALNNITTKDRYPLPRIDNLLDRLRRAKHFTKIDLRNGYYNVRIADGDEWKTAFRTRYGSFEFLVMPFGLTNAPAAFQHFMNDVFHDMLDQSVCGYLDDLLIFTDSDDISEHVEKVRTVLQRLRDNHLFAKFEKCSFHTSEIEFLGYVVSPAGISMDTAKTSAISSWPTPNSVRDVQSFLGFANFYRRFIDRYSNICRPMYDSTKKNSIFKWTPECHLAFETLKKAFTCAPILMHFMPEYRIWLETDASDYAIAAILSQINPETGELHPVAFFSRSMSPPELNYEVHDKELLAIFAAFKEWRSYLEGPAHTVTVVTDHKTLEYFSTTKVLTRRQARWSEYLSGFNYAIKYRPGRLGGKPDALTRRSDVYPKRGDGAFALNNPQNLQTIFRDGQLMSSLRATSVLNSDCASKASCVLRASILDMDDLRTDILAGLVQDPVAAKYLTDLPPPYSASPSGFLLHNLRIYVPDFKSLRLRLMQLKHDHPTAGHFGFVKTLDLIRREFYWPNLRSDVTEFCRTCLTCPRAKAPRHKPYGHLKQLPIPLRPWESISMDLIEGIPESDEYDSILVIVERLTKMALFIPTTKRLTSPELARLYVLHVFSKHGIPSDVISDRGSEFVSAFWTSLSKVLEMDLRPSTAYHPQTDGQTERTNQTLEAYLRSYINYKQDDWVDFLPLAEFAYNNSVHSATTVSPFFANYGYHPRLTMSLDTEVPSAEAHDFAKSISELHSFVRRELAAAQAQYQPAADARRNLNVPEFKQGDKVWLMAKNIKTQRPMKKLDHRRLGPYKISEKISSHAFRLDLPKDLSAIHNVFHIDLLEPFHANSFPGRSEPPPPSVKIAGEEEFEVESILDSRIFRRQLQYRVKWKGYDAEGDSATWEPAAHFKHSKEVISDFHKAHPNAPAPPKPPKRRR